MKNLTLTTLMIALLFCGVPTILSAQMDTSDEKESTVEEKFHNRRFFVDCDRGATLTWALDRASRFARAEIMFKGTCEEVLLIDRDHLILRGVGSNPVLAGLIDVVGASNVVIKDFEIRAGEGQPTGTPFGGVNAVDGSAVTVANMHIHDLSARGIRVISSSARLRDITVEQAANGAYVFRGSNLVLEGSISSEGGAFGMSFVDSNAFARNAALTFRAGVFGMIIQLSSALEHVEGSLIVEENAIGLLLAAQGVYAYGSFIEARLNSAAGILVDELSSFTPLNNAPGGGPSLIVEDHEGAFGVVVNRGSTLQLTEPTIIENNGIGLFVDSSTLIMAGTILRDNGFNMDLSFGAWATFQSNNEITEPYQCDSDVLARGTINFCQDHQSMPNLEHIGLKELEELMKNQLDF